MFDELETEEFKNLREKYYEIYGKYPVFNFDDYYSLEEYMNIVKRKVEPGGEKIANPPERKSIRKQSWENYLSKRQTSQNE